MTERAWCEECDAELFGDARRDEICVSCAEGLLYERHREQESSAKAWDGVTGQVAECDGSPDVRHIGAPCMACGATPPGWFA